MKKFRQFLKDRLKGKIPEKKLDYLPSGYQKIGDIIILNLREEVIPYKRRIAKLSLEKIPHTKTVCLKSGSVSGEKRRPEIEVIAGNGTETLHKENNCRYKLDVSQVMFSQGNLTERGRIAGLVQKGETIVDGFAGIGYFSLPIAKTGRPEKIYCIDINPVSVRYLKENIKLNRVGNTVVPILGDFSKTAPKDTAYRVILGYLPETYRFLPPAYRCLKSEGVIHYHDTYREEELWDKPERILEEEAEKTGYRVEKIAYRNKVKSYAPKVYHVVLDAHVFSKTKK